MRWPTLSYPPLVLHVEVTSVFVAVDSLGWVPTVACWGMTVNWINVVRRHLEKSKWGLLSLHVGELGSEIDISL